MASIEAESNSIESETVSPPTDAPSEDPNPSVTAAQPTWIETHRAALATEPRDDSWAYFTEQAVEQYLAQHSGISQFTVDFIECRSTVCQIGVEGFDESAGPTWQRILYDMRQQPWYEFSRVNTSTGDVEGRLKTVTEIKLIVGD